MTDILTELDTYLRSNDRPPDSLGLSDLDGFLTGLVCTPKPVANWADAAFGAGVRVPKRIMELTTQRMDQIAAGLAAATPVLEPVFWQAPEGHAIAMDWCEGFMEAVKLDVAAWDTFGQSAIGSKLMMPILVHMFDDGGNSMFGIAEEDIDQTLEVAAEAVPRVVPLIYREMRQR